MMQNGSLSKDIQNPELDVTKLQALPAEQQDIYLLTFITNLTHHVENLDPDDCTAQQFYLKKELLQIINFTAPAPTRLVRNNVGRCLAHIFGKGDRKLLFETINDLIAIVGSSRGKTDAELRTKTAAAHSLGEVFASAGDSAIGLHALTCSTLLKQLKSAQNNTGYRSVIFTALSKIVGMVKHSTDENIAKDVWKQAKNYASIDKSGRVQICACRCLEAMSSSTPYFNNSSDYDTLKTTVFKTFESPISAVRSAGASCLAAILVKSYAEMPIVDAGGVLKKIRRTNTKKNMEDDEEIQRPESPGPKKSSLVSFSLPDMLKQLSTQYVRMSVSNRARAGLIVCYSTVMKGLGQTVVEAQYIKIADHLMCELLNHSHIGNNRYRLLITRRFVQVILEDVIGKQILGESGQVAAAKLLVNDVLKNYPQALKERPEPSKHALIASLSALTSIITTVGSASSLFADSCRDGLLQAIQHPSYTVQVYASRCLRTFTLACPQQLLPCLTVCMNSVNRELNNLGTGRNAPRRCIGYANGLAAMISASSAQPLYGSVDVYSRVLSLATGLLKNSGKSELRLSSTQIQVAWILIGGLMSLGPNFVKIHLSQLLLLWKNALPKPLAKDNTSQRTYLEVSFLTHVRECALGSILAFLQFNSRLLTTDVSKRIATMLQNTSVYLKGLPFKKTTEDMQSRLSPALQLVDLDMMVQRRVLQCYASLVTLSPAGGSESLLQSNLLTLAISFFADPENYTRSSLSTSIASSASTFDSIWDVGDNCGFGVSGLVNGFRLHSLPGEQERAAQSNWAKGDDSELTTNAVLTSPICASFEHDSLSLYVHDPTITENIPDPPATEVVNIAIKLFSIAFPLTPARIQESILEQVATFLSTSSLQREPARKAAMTVNIALALLYTLKVANKETSSSSGSLAHPAVQKTMQELIRAFVTQSDSYLRNIGYEALGRLCSIAGNAFTNQEIKYLIDTIVANRDPSARAGCAMSLGCIHSQVGGMAASFHLKTILGVLMSLCNDPNPTVHVWALEGLALIIDSAGLTFSGYAASTLGLLGQLYIGDCHNDEIPSQANSNLELEVSTTRVIARCVDALVNVLGPDLADMSKARELILILIEQLQKESSSAVLAESLRCLGNFSLYAPGHLHFVDYVKLLQRYLGSDVVVVRDLAIDGLYSLMKRNADDVVRSAQPGLEDQIWLVLDASPAHEGVQNLLRNWLQQSCISDTATWIQRCQKVLTMTKMSNEALSSATKTSNMPDLQDEEVAGFAGEAGKDDANSDGAQGQEPLRWQVRAFAMSCLGEMFILVNKDTVTNGPGSAELLVQQRVADIIRMAFSASTSNVVELRVWGLKIIDHVLRMFGKTSDPDFPEAALLEQYQAQISSALTPAFAADSSPELAAEAVNVCAAFIATGIVTDVDRMGRILKTLETALENFSLDSETAAIGELKGLSSNAHVMVKMAVFSAWAELQVASTDQQYLVNVLKPHIAALTPLWLASLREFARLRFEPDISMSLGPPSLSGSLDSIYSALNRETLLKFYQDSWLKLVDAIASLIEQDSEFVFDALDGKAPTELAINSQSNGSPKQHNEINYRDEPVAFFFVLFGIAFEALASRPGNEVLASREQNLPILLALKKILRPSVSGQAIYREAIFSETMDLLDRLVLTEGLDVQSVIVQIARDLCIAHPSARKRDDPEGDLSEDIEQLFELTRIIVLVLAGLVPNLTDTKQTPRGLTEETISLIRVSLNALVDAAEVFPSIIKTDLHACIIHIFATILGTASCQSTIVPMSLPILKRFITSITTTPTANVDKMTRIQIQGCFKKFLTIYTHAQKREAEASLSCVKNALLASTVVLTSGRNSLSAKDPVAVKYLDEVLDCLSDRMTAKVASNCIRTLLLQQDRGDASNSLRKYLIPRLISFITNTSPADPELARSLVTSALTTWVTTLSSSSIEAGISLLIPTLLERAMSECIDKEENIIAIQQEISVRLLELAAADQGAFKGVVACMAPEQKIIMEKVIRSGKNTAGNARRVDEDEESGEPTIALRMNFGR